MGKGGGVPAQSRMLSKQSSQDAENNVRSKMEWKDKQHLRGQAAPARGGCGGGQEGKVGSHLSIS